LWKSATLLHLAGSGRLILRTQEKIKPGTILCDDKGFKVAKVLEMFGPVKSPYASAVPMSDRWKQALGKKLYIIK
jgi:RNA-binding protein